MLAACTSIKLHTCQQSHVFRKRYRLYDTSSTASPASVSSGAVAGQAPDDDVKDSHDARDDSL